MVDKWPWPMVLDLLEEKEQRQTTGFLGKAVIVVSVLKLMREENGVAWSEREVEVVVEGRSRGVRG